MDQAFENGMQNLFDEGSISSKKTTEPENRPVKTVFSRKLKYADAGRGPVTETQDENENPLEESRSYRHRSDD